MVISSFARLEVARSSLRLAALVVGGVLALAACDGPSAPVAKETSSAVAASSVAGATTAPAKQGRAFGEPIKTADETMLDAIAAEPSKFSGKTIKTSGVVQAVCQAAGCWMEIGDESKRAHVKMAGHSFFVPKDCAGKHAVVEGTVVAAPAEDECGMKDQCGGAEHGAIAKTEILATGVELLD
ncbi:MAG TPA: DUF4920 domain-containing protein [Polyangiaceae bacterium]|jgi:hypothetical protein|nr:DUF4920 domain-containing protein [Polyangiaceae bacterium]